MALLLPDQAPEVAHGLRQGPWAAMNSRELQRPLEGGRRVRAPLPPALTFRGSRAQADSYLTGMKLALMYSEPGCPGGSSQGHSGPVVYGETPALAKREGAGERGEGGDRRTHGSWGWGEGPRREEPAEGLPAHGGRSLSLEGSKGRGC